MFKRLRAIFFMIFNRKKLIADMKPKLVFWYITFDGDQEKIKEAMMTDYGLSNKENYTKILEEANLNDYIMILEKGFDRITKGQDAIVIKKPK